MKKIEQQILNGAIKMNIQKLIKKNPEMLSIAIISFIAGMLWKFLLIVGLIAGVLYFVYTKYWKVKK